MEKTGRSATALAATYRRIRQAILDHCCLTAAYDARVRHFCPHAIGLDKAGAVRVLGLQYGGETTSALPPGGDWRCFRIVGLTQVRRSPDRWRTKPGHSQANSCVVQVDVEAYPSPTSPTPKLANAAKAPIIARLRRPARKGGRATDPVRE